MPKISNKGLEMPESPIRKLVPFAEAATKKRAKNISTQYWSARH